jgi:cell division protein FtsQ
MTATLRGGAVIVHPRMRSRRIAVRRSAGRRRLRRVLLALGAVTGLVGLYALAWTPLLDVDEVRVRGGERMSPQVIAAASGIAPGDPMIQVDTGAGERRIEELAWVREVRVQRVWPGTVRIEVKERSPVAVVQVTKSSAALVDGTGRVLTIGQDVASSDLAVLTGVDGRVAEGERLPAKARDAATVLGALVERLPGQVAAMSTDLEATLADGGVVRFGTADDLEDKLVATETMLSDVSLACLQVLDVRVPGNPTLTRHAGCS